MADFTGERVIPEQVEQDLWNEHVARYAFASRLARRKRVLDAACGTGYGSAELARAASSVVGLDVSCEALGYAQARYRLPNVSFLQASCATMPFRTGSFDLVVAFEVIEHIREWSMFLSEIRRVLTPGGQAIISTPNSCYYSASRGHTGPNPYHYQEFTYEEFREELARVFPHVLFFLQNHVEGFIFQPVKTFSAAEARYNDVSSASTEIVNPADVRVLGAIGFHARGARGASEIARLDANACVPGGLGTP